MLKRINDSMKDHRRMYGTPPNAYKTPETLLLGRAAPGWSLEKELNMKKKALATKPPSTWGYINKPTVKNTKKTNNAPSNNRLTKIENDLREIVKRLNQLERNSKKSLPPPPPPPPPPPTPKPRVVVPKKPVRKTVTNNKTNYTSLAQMAKVKADQRTKRMLSSIRNEMKVTDNKRRLNELRRQEKEITNSLFLG